MKRRSEQGVALVVTLILLSVITFMTVTFLAVSRREREGVINRSNQNDAIFANNAGFEQAKAQIVAQMLANNNGFNFDFLVSTNFINSAGFDPGFSPLTPVATNVNYEHLFGNTTPLTPAQFQQNLANLLILPRAPVFITTNKNQAVAEFRYYLDLNRNGSYDPNGLVGLTNNSGLQILDTNNVPTTNFMRGDPEWVGILDHPDRPHSRSNLFIGRTAFVAMPIGNSLDINYIHNQAGLVSPTPPLGYPFLRNQGVGTWEINLAAFLYTLNTNIWGVSAINYNYDPIGNGQTTGLGFQDAASILKYRYGGVNLASVRALYGKPGADAFKLDFVDGYSAGLLMTNAFPLSVDSDPPAEPWSGADNPVKFFTSQDLFNVGALPAGSAGFSNSLYSAGTNISTYDRYTFYNLLAQMGVDSVPDRADKLNLNYMNIGGLSPTNFISWTNALQFFTNAADRMLRAQYTNSISITNIPIYDGTNFYYSPAIHRVLQLAANIYDATTNRPFAPGATNYYPSVFRPTFGSKKGAVFINGFVEEGTAVQNYMIKPLSLPEDADTIAKKPNLTTNIYGVPWVIGAKKGFPNFNEFAMQTVSQVTRKLQISRPPNTPNDRNTWSTNQMYVVGISNIMGVELWNSYSSNYSRAIDVVLFDDLTMTLTNDTGLVLTTNVPMAPVPFTIPATGPTQWQGFLNTQNPNKDKLSFRAPLFTNVVLLPDSVYRQNPQGFVVSTNFEQNTAFRLPNFVLGVTNRLRVALLDNATKRVIDYVQFNGMDEVREITKDLSKDDKFPWVWRTNRVGGITGPIEGIINQMQVSIGAVTVSLTEWNNARIKQSTQQSKDLEINGFASFYNNPSANSNLLVEVPFSPTRKYSKARSWQANDPLVHYTLGDLTDVNDFQNTNQLISVIPPNGSTMTNVLVNIFAINGRYAPWGGNPKQVADPNKYNLALKDPLVNNSDAWDFPTNKFPNVGWLGRVHRGTPWQTVYLKSKSVDPVVWQQWSGNPNPANAVFSQPTNDWALLDIFTTAQN
ncbi:MAG: hypothetical protein JWQ71_1025, partial [Pedosphaera sp.]|nr:hypothetical protein [Pedosphaera sp.]